MGTPIQSKSGTVGLFEGNGIAIGGGVASAHTIKCYEPDEDDPTAVVEVDSFIYPAVFDDGSGQWVADTEASPVTSAVIGAYLAPSAGAGAYLFNQFDDPDATIPLPCSGGAFVMPDVDVCVLDQR